MKKTEIIVLIFVFCSIFYVSRIYNDNKAEKLEAEIAEQDKRLKQLQAELDEKNAKIEEIFAANKKHLEQAATKRVKKNKKLSDEPGKK